MIEDSFAQVFGGAMKLLFIQGGTRLKQDTEGNWYTDGNFNDSVWKRYTSVCDELTVVLRKEDTIYKPEDAKKKFNQFDTKSINLVPIEDIYKPVTRYLNPVLRNRVYATIKREIEKVDRVIIRSVITFYTISALEICQKLNKPYLIEVTGVAWDANWYHSLQGKLTAYSTEQGVKKRLKNAPYALYVTQHEMQQRYPCNGKTVGCSNVELDSIDQFALENRRNKIEAGSSPVVIGTIGGYKLKTKGQILVIKALGQLKRKGITNIEYQLVGGGDNTYLKNEAEKQGVLNQVKFLDSMPHEKIFEWLDRIDIYVQPSYQEGLCRSVVEAMSRACPVICSDACGERELADERFIFKRGDWKTLAIKIENMSKKEMMLEQAERGYKKSFDYKKETLDKRRHDFYMDFINS